MGWVKFNDDRNWILLTDDDFRFQIFDFACNVENNIMQIPIRLLYLNNICGQCWSRGGQANTVVSVGPKTFEARIVKPS